MSISGIETALIVLVIIWTIIFITVAIAVIFIFLAIRRAVNKANKIIDVTEEKANKFDLPSKLVTAGVLAFMVKNSGETIKKVIQLLASNKQKTKE